MRNLNIPLEDVLPYYLTFSFILHFAPIIPKPQVAITFMKNECVVAWIEPTLVLCTRRVQRKA